MPWSKVWCIRTTGGDYFVKKVKSPFDIELQLLPTLSSLYRNAIPFVIDINLSEQAIIMADHGTPLRDKLKLSYDSTLVLKALDLYTSIQRDFEDKQEVLFEMGLLDWRLNNLPFLFKTFLEEKKMLLIEDGLTSTELTRLKERLTLFEAQCRRAASFKIADTLEHGDFHDNNILIKQHEPCINDWGDAVVTHPFFSLESFLVSAYRQHQIKNNSLLYEKLRDHYLSKWGDELTVEDQRKAFQAIKRINPIKFFLSFSRIAECDKKGLSAYRGNMAEGLRGWLKE